MWNAIRPWLFPVWCIGCGCMDVGLCRACRAAAVPTWVRAGDLAVRAAASYDGHVRSALLAMKRGERAYLDPLGDLLAAQIAPGSTLIPAVTTRRRAAERGFDQARELARRAVCLRGGTVADVLRKRGGPQRGAGRSMRLAAHGRFAIRRGAELPAAALLVDDVVTTGATLRDAAATLAAAGVAVLGAVVIARAPARETSARGGESDRA